jgi:hypothetical protein
MKKIHNLVYHIKCPSYFWQIKLLTLLATAMDCHIFVKPNNYFKVYSIHLAFILLFFFTSEQVELNIYFIEKSMFLLSIFVLFCTFLCIWITSLIFGQFD